MKKNLVKNKIGLNFKHGSENNTIEQFAEYLEKYHNRNLNDIIIDFKLEYSP